MKRKLTVLLVMTILAFAGYKYLYQDHRDIQKEQSEFVVSSSSIANEFSQNTIKAEKKYLDKTIEINGIVTEVNETDLTINSSVFCQFNSVINSSINIKDTITIKGRCIGYDDLLEIIKIDQSTIIN